MFYKLGINPSSKKWAKYENISSSLWIDNIEITSTKLFTDPDFAGKKIRSVIESRIPKIKHAFISKKEATKVDNIGVENASDASILEALKHVITHRDESTGGNLFSASDLIDNGLTSGSNSKERRAKLGDILKIGYYNSKQLLKALNSFNISREQFEKAISEIDS